LPTASPCDHYGGVDDTAGDPKAGERLYYRRLGAAGMAHARGKPFSDERCAYYLADAAALMMLFEPPPRRVLELGCGPGWLSIFLARIGYEVTGVDISPDAIDLARESAAAEGLQGAHFVVGDYEAAVAGQFDYVVFYDALHHAEDEARALAAAYAALRPGGALYAFEPGEGHGTSESSRRAVAEFGVHEKDMPPARIIALGRLAGFSRSVVLPSPHELTKTVYRRDFQRQRSSGNLFVEKLWGYFRALKRFTRQRRGGLTVLWK
jgi:SAM-dependent methyltransferase